MKNPKKTEPRRGRRPPYQSGTDTGERVSVTFQISARTRRFLEQIAEFEDTPFARAIEIYLERAIALDAWLKALQADPRTLGNNRLEVLLREAGWNNPAPNLWLRPAELQATGLATEPAAIERPALTINMETKK
jgi:hypothetical protein